MSAAISPPNESTLSSKKNQTDWKTLWEGKGAIIVAGDFSARKIEWSMLYASRGKHVLELAVQLSRSMINVRNVSTFRRPGYTETFQYNTCWSQNLKKRTLVAGWKISEEYTSFDVQYIVFNCKEKEGQIDTLGKNLNGLLENWMKTSSFQQQSQRRQCAGQAQSWELVVKLIHANEVDLPACNVSILCQRKSFRRRRVVYWWSERIATLKWMEMDGMYTKIVNECIRKVEYIDTTPRRLLSTANAISWRKLKLGWTVTLGVWATGCHVKPWGPVNYPDCVFTIHGNHCKYIFPTLSQ